MTWMVVAVILLVAFASLLAVAEASVTRVSRVRALALREEGRRNAALLVQIEEDPARYLNTIYFSAVSGQNGSAILVAIIADRAFGRLAVTAISVAFTLVYFVVAEAMAKTFGVLHSDSAALALSPVVVALARVFAWPVRALIGLANVLLPGRGLKEGPFVSEEEIRQMAEVGHESGTIQAEEKELIHSIFELGDTVVKNVMTPRPDMVVVERDGALRTAMDLAIAHGFSRIPVVDREPDNIVGVVHAKELFKALREPEDGRVVGDVMGEPYLVPETMRVADLMRDMQKLRVHMAIVVDEYGDVAGLVTLEDVIEEIVGEITDEYDVEESRILPLGPDRWRVQAKMAIWELNELLDTKLPEDEEWQTIGGLVASALGKVPETGDEITYGGLSFRAEKVQRRRVDTVLVRRVGDADDGVA